MSTPKSVLVISATGKQGGAVVDALLRLGPRSTSSGNPDGIFDKAAEAGPIWGVFSVHTNNDDEESQGKGVVDAAVLHGVQHFVQASGDRGGPVKSEQGPTNAKNFVAKFNIEKHQEKRAEMGPQKMSYTILRPVAFFENLTPDVHGKGFARMWEQMGTQKRLHMVATRDIGWFAAQTFIYPDSPGYRNAGLTLVGDKLTQADANAIFERVAGHPMAIVPCPVGSALMFLMRGTIGDMLRWFAEVGYGGNVEECHKQNPTMQDFETWLKNSSPFVPH